MFQHRRSDYRPPLCGGPCRSDRAVTAWCMRLRITPQTELLVPFVCLLPHTAAFHSHGWRLRLVRPNNDGNPTRLSLKTSPSLSDAATHLPGVALLASVKQKSPATKEKPPMLCRASLGEAGSTRTLNVFHLCRPAKNRGH